VSPTLSRNLSKSTIVHSATVWTRWGFSFHNFWNLERFIQRKVRAGEKWISGFIADVAVAFWITCLSFTTSGPISDGLPYGDLFAEIFWFAFLWLETCVLRPNSASGERHQKKSINSVQFRHLQSRSVSEKKTLTGGYQREIKLEVRAKCEREENFDRSEQLNEREEKCLRWEMEDNY
jgi:hypothetical protein